jgi:hypothetical protein
VIALTVGRLKVDGYAACWQFRRPLPSKPVKMMALTGREMAEDRGVGAVWIHALRHIRTRSQGGGRPLAVACDEPITYT